MNEWFIICYIVYMPQYVRHDARTDSTFPRLLAKQTLNRASTKQATCTPRLYFHCLANFSVLCISWIIYYAIRNTLCKLWCMVFHLCSNSRSSAAVSNSGCHSWSDKDPASFCRWWILVCYQHHWGVSLWEYEWDCCLCTPVELLL